MHLNSVVRWRHFPKDFSVRVVKSNHFLIHFVNVLLWLHYLKICLLPVVKSLIFSVLSGNVRLSKVLGKESLQIVQKLLISANAFIPVLRLLQFLYRYSTIVGKQRVSSLLLEKRRLQVNHLIQFTKGLKFICMNGRTIQIFLLFRQNTGVAFKVVPLWAIMNRLRQRDGTKSQNHSYCCLFRFCTFTGALVIS